ncbi:transcriptional regulator [Citricoccus zhacaiensis]|uniref:Transcriptional regulator n=1 Tax=Citricoccus zhacaiensis TaxID=489142 RepID=A0ABQ2M7H3_9MICC|nr:BlaI/MecI/CopY family transcriptional regulator [Citricoccus zhacaiensis]GGO46818.1 transcriptional regulator [Citricoccus zhacaiensis]
MEIIALREAPVALGDLERSVMDLLWDQPGAHTANDVRDALAGDLAVTTVLTVLSRLEKKGLVRRDGGRRPHRYAAASSREDHTVGLLNEVLGSVPDREAVLARFIGGIGPDEAAAVRRLLES